MRASHWQTVQAVLHKDHAKGRIVGMTCPTCGRKWDVRDRGSETGFIVAAANSHSSKCARLKHEAGR